MTSREPAWERLFTSRRANGGFLVFWILCLVATPQSPALFWVAMASIVLYVVTYLVLIFRAIARQLHQAPYPVRVELDRHIRAFRRRGRVYH